MNALKIVQKQKQKEKGFTLVELITVVAIVSLLVVYITIKLGSSNEDAKVALASTFILGNVPTVISSYKARHKNSCTGLNELPDDTTLRNELMARGLVGTTPWNEDWEAAYDNTNRLLQIMFPTSGMEDAQGAAQDIVRNIWDAPQIDGLAIAADQTLITEYNEDTHGTRRLVAGAGGDDGTDAADVSGFATELDRTGSIQIWYDCI